MLYAHHLHFYEWLVMWVMHSFYWAWWAPTGMIENWWIWMLQNLRLLSYMKPLKRSNWIVMKLCGYLAPGISSSSEQLLSIINKTTKFLSTRFSFYIWLVNRSVLAIFFYWKLTHIYLLDRLLWAQGVMIWDLYCGW